MTNEIIDIEITETPIELIINVSVTIPESTNINISDDGDV